LFGDGTSNAIEGERIEAVFNTCLPRKLKTA
jgi:hypothetical protein